MNIVSAGIGKRGGGVNSETTVCFLDSICLN
jgi:hypothetical protein